jgi:phage tail tape-measure protein
MPKYDGAIRIDTKINTKGADKGISTLSTSLKGFASAVGVAFGIGAIVSFGKAAVQASSELSNAMTGLQSIAEGSGRSFAQANKFIQDYISDGLVPATNAVTAYKNLLSRGYDTEQIENIMTRLKDAAAFGRQASYSLGDAVTSATEGLKNENSVLVNFISPLLG